MLLRDLPLSHGQKGKLSLGQVAGFLAFSLFSPILTPLDFPRLFFPFHHHHNDGVCVI